MAKKGEVSGNRLVKKHIKRKGVHSKNKMSKTKGSALYVKPYAGQGRGK